MNLWLRWHKRLRHVLLLAWHGRRHRSLRAWVHRHRHRVDEAGWDRHHRLAIAVPCYGVEVLALWLLWLRLWGRAIGSLDLVHLVTTVLLLVVVAVHHVVGIVLVARLEASLVLWLVPLILTLRWWHHLRGEGVAGWVHAAHTCRRHSSWIESRRTCWIEYVASGLRRECAACRWVKAWRTRVWLELCDAGAHLGLSCIWFLRHASTPKSKQVKM